MTICKIFITLSLVVSMASAGSDGKCRGLVFSGGGDRGAYEAGVLQTFTEMLPANEVAYDIIVGTSAGSLNVAGFALEKQGNEKEAAANLRNLWDSISQSDVYKNWPLGIAQGLFSEYGLYDTSPLKSYIQSLFNKYGGPKRDYSICATNANLAVPERFNQTMTESQDITATMASSAFPVFLPHIQIGNYPYMDGGLFLNVDIGGAILRCREMGYADQNIYIDSLFCDNGTLSKVDATKYTTGPITGRGISMVSYSLTQRDYVYAKEDYPNVNYRYTVMPTEDLPGGVIPLLFDHDDIEKCIQIGINDAKKVLEKGEGVEAELVYQRLKGQFSADYNPEFYSVGEDYEDYEVTAMQ